jgi:hypothetical protein
MCEILVSIFKGLLCCLSNESFQRIFLDMAAQLAAQTENTIDDMIVEELRRRLRERPRAQVG